MRECLYLLVDWSRDRFRFLFVQYSLSQSRTHIRAGDIKVNIINCFRVEWHLPTTRWRIRTVLFFTIFCLADLEWNQSLRSSGTHFIYLETNRPTSPLLNVFVSLFLAFYSLLGGLVTGSLPPAGCVRCLNPGNTCACTITTPRWRKCNRFCYYQHFHTPRRRGEWEIRKGICCTAKRWGEIILGGLLSQYTYWQRLCIMHISKAIFLKNFFLPSVSL